MIEMIFLFICLVALEVIFEIDNITALKRKAKTLAPGLLTRGQMPHILALGVRISLAYMLYHVLSLITGSMGYQNATANAHITFKMIGGLIIMALGLTLLAQVPQASNKSKELAIAARKSQVAPGTLISFLIIDAILSLDSVIATVAMTSNFDMAVTALASAAVVIMLFHQQINRWLKLNPRVIVLAYLLITALGVNLMLEAYGNHISKLYLLGFAAFAIWINGFDKQPLKKLAAKGKAVYRQADDLVVEQLPEGQIEVKAKIQAQLQAQAQAVAAQSTKKGEFYTFGTAHDAALTETKTNKIGFGQATIMTCHNCGAQTVAGVSVCANCKSYSYLLSGRGMEIGALNQVHEEKDQAEIT